MSENGNDGAYRADEPGEGPVDDGAAQDAQSPYTQSAQEYAQTVQQYFQAQQAAAAAGSEARPGPALEPAQPYPIPPEAAQPADAAAYGWAPQQAEVTPVQEGYHPGHYEPDDADPQHPYEPAAAAAHQQPEYQQLDYQQPPAQYQQPEYQQPVEYPPAEQYPPARQWDAAQQFPPAEQYPPAQQWNAAQQYQPPPAPPAPQPPVAAAQPPVPAAQPAPAPPAIPAPESLLVPTKLDLAAEPASWGWRGTVNRASGGLIKTKAARAEIDARNAIKRIQRSFSRPMTVVVVQPKGGAGKTPTTVCLSAAFGAHRGGYVVGWDDNETRGTLAVRVSNPDSQQSTVWDLLSDLSAFERYDARVGDLSFYVRAQPDAHFDALVSDDNPANMAQIGEEAFQRLHTVLQRFYRVIVVDTGNNVRSPNWQAAVNAADLIVAVSTYQRDVGYSASWVLDHLAQTGREELARNAVTVLTAGDPTTDREVRAQLVEHFSARTRSVVEIPYDTEIAHGGPIRWSHLHKNTRNAWIEAGATVVDALSEHDQRTLAARRTS